MARYIEFTRARVLFFEHILWRESMFGSLEMGELIVILAMVILIFGVNKIPKLGKGLGEGIRNFNILMNNPIDRSHPRSERHAKSLFFVAPRIAKTLYSNNHFQLPIARRLSSPAP
jgi:sec-independent protein translocase protein TatA